MTLNGKILTEAVGCGLGPVGGAPRVELLWDIPGPRARFHGELLCLGLSPGGGFGDSGFGGYGPALGPSSVYCSFGRHPGRFGCFMPPQKVFPERAFYSTLGVSVKEFLGADPALL